MTDKASAPVRRKRTAMEVLRSVGQPKVGVMLALGFSSGLPFLLTGNTLGYWLRDEGTSLKAIGFLSWVGLAYSIKYLWAPLVDRLDVPILGRWLGRRRGWMALSQMLVAAGLIGMALVGPEGGLTAIGSGADQRRGRSQEVEVGTAVASRVMVPWSPGVPLRTSPARVTSISRQAGRAPRASCGSPRPTWRTRSTGWS